MMLLTIRGKVEGMEARLMKTNRLITPAIEKRKSSLQQKFFLKFFFVYPLNYAIHTMFNVIEKFFSKKKFEVVMMF